MALTGEGLIAPGDSSLGRHEFKMNGPTWGTNCQQEEAIMAPRLARRGPRNHSLTTGKVHSTNRNDSQISTSLSTPPSVYVH